MKSFLNDFHFDYWLAGQLSRYPYRPDRRDLRIRLANMHLEEDRNTSTTGGNDLVHPSWHTLQNLVAAQMSKIDWFRLATNYNRCPYRDLKYMFIQEGGCVIVSETNNYEWHGSVINVKLQNLKKICRSSCTWWSKIYFLKKWAVFKINFLDRFPLTRWVQIRNLF